MTSEDAYFLSITRSQWHAYLFISMNNMLFFNIFYFDKAALEILF